MLPNEVTPMWGLGVDHKKRVDEHASWWASRELNRRQLQDFKNMITGGDLQYDLNFCKDNKD